MTAGETAPIGEHMTYGPPVIKQCEYCKKEYKCANHRAHKSRFCTITCRNKFGLLERIEYVCVNCNNKFMALPDHGAERKFCSRKCFLSHSLQPIDKECKNCGKMFTAGKSSSATHGDGRRLYCSFKCGSEGRRKSKKKPCVVCGTFFYPINVTSNARQKTCSMKCKAEFFSGSMASNYKGGFYIPNGSNQKMVLIGKRSGYVGKYTGEHRLNVAKYIGRFLMRNEIVIHINSNGLDNKLSNLFVCESKNEYGRRRFGSLPWPKKSNLNNFKEKNI